MLAGRAEDSVPLQSSLAGLTEQPQWKREKNQMGGGGCEGNRATPLSGGAATGARRCEGRGYVGGGPPGSQGQSRSDAECLGEFKW